MNLKKIKDTRFGRLQKLFSFLVGSEQVSDATELCDDILVAQKTVDLSDDECFLALDGFLSENSNPERIKEIQDKLADKFDLPESLDSTIYDYVVHSHVKFVDALEALNEILSLQEKVAFCSQLTNPINI